MSVGAGTSDLAASWRKRAVRTVIMPAMWCTLTGNMWAIGRCLFPPAGGSDTVSIQVDG